MIRVLDYLVAKVQGRSPKWPALRRAHLKMVPKCEVCGTDQDCDVHHVVPFGVRPESELSVGNLMTLCREHHLLFGHLMSWGHWNPNVWTDVRAMREKIELRCRI